MGHILKQWSFTEMTMPDRVIEKVNWIGLQEKQGSEFHFLNQSKELYEWTNTIMEDDPEFQGLLEEEAPFPEMSAKLPGLSLQEDEEDFQVVTKSQLQTLKLLQQQHWRMQELIQEIVCAPREMPLRRLAWACSSECATADWAKPDKIMYDITFELPDAGLLPSPINNLIAEDDTATHPSVD
jgi:hypothetical protein